MSDATGPDFVQLNLTHRCDQCGAAAVAQVEIDESLPHLLFCGHHWRANMLRIRELGYAYDVPEEFDYLFTDREVAARPREYALRDAGSS